MLPDPSVLIAFAVASTVLILTPGPDMTLFLGSTLAGGRRLGFAALLGATTGLFVHIGLAVFGLSALLAASPTAFAALKIAGAAYLLWLAVDSIRRGSALNIDRRRPGGRSFREVYLTGIGINLLNPKVALFFLTFFPQFVSAGDPHAIAKLLSLGVLFQALSAPMGAAIILAAERVAAALRRSPKIMRAIDWLFAGIFGLFALKLLTAQAR
jgi:threonine/homoserine/homoserine lactone efflux protein